MGADEILIGATEQLAGPDSSSLEGVRNKIIKGYPTIFEEIKRILCCGSTRDSSQDSSINENRNGGAAATTGNWLSDHGWMRRMLSFIGGPKDNDYYVRARLKQFSATGLLELSFLKVCLAASLAAKQPDIFQLNVLSAAVDYHWNKFGFLCHAAYFFVYLVLAALVVLVNILIDSVELSNSTISGMITATIVLSSAFLFFEILQLFTHCAGGNSVEYFNDSFVGWVAYSLILTGSVYRYSFGRESKTSADIMAVATLFVFLKGVDFLKPFKPTGPTIRIVYTILGQIIPFLVILVVLIVGFSQAFYLLSYADPSRDSHGAGASILFAYIYMTGQANWSDMFQTAEPVEAQFLMCFFIALSTILVLNVIIAKMNNVYSDVESNAAAEWKREQCKFVTEYGAVGNVFCGKKWNQLDKRYVSILMRDEYCEERKQDYLRRKFSNITQNKIMTLLKTQREVMKMLEAKEGSGSREEPEE